MHCCLLDLNQTNDKWLVITAHVRIPVDMLGSKDTSSVAHSQINMSFQVSDKRFLSYECVHAKNTHLDRKSVV